MERQVGYSVRGLENARRAHRVEARLYNRNGVHEAHADAANGRVWMRYDAGRLQPPRLEAYLREAGVVPVQPQRVDRS